MISSPEFSLTTLDQVRLTGPAGPVVVSDPATLALLILLGLTDQGSLARAELLLRMFPDLTPVSARQALDLRIAELNRGLGRPVIQAQGDRYVLEPGIVQLDVFARPAGATGDAETSRRFLAEFPLLATPEFREWVEAVRPRLAPVEAPGDGSDPRPRSRLQVALLLGLVLAGLGFWLGGDRSAPGRPSETGSVVVLAELENTTGDSIFDHGLTTAAAVALQQSSHVSLLPRSRVTGAMDRMGLKEPYPPLGFSLAREIAQREGVSLVVAPRIVRDGPGYRVSAVVLDVTTQDVLLDPSADAEGPAGVIPALDRVLREVRSGLGESRQALRERTVSLDRVTTPSLEALRSYTDGSRAWTRGEYLLARDFWLRALDIDTGFAMAMGSLGSFNYYHHEREEGRRYFQAALARVDRLTEYERLQLELSWAGYRGAGDSAIALSRRIADRYPTAATWYALGTTLMQNSRCEEAFPAFQRSLTFDSSFVNTHLNLAVCLRHTQPAEAIGHFTQASRFDANALLRGNVSFEYGMTLLASSLNDSARSHFTRLIEQPGMYERILGYRGLAWLALAEENPRAAAGHFESATGIARQQGAAISIARGLLAQGLSLRMAGDTAAARPVLNDMMDLIGKSTIPPPFLAVFGNNLALTGMEREATTLLQQLKRTASPVDLGDQAAEKVLEASLSLSRGDARGALERVEGISRVSQPAMLTLLRATALERLGQADSARALRAGLKLTSVWGTEAAFEWLRHVQR